VRPDETIHGLVRPGAGEPPLPSFVETIVCDLEVPEAVVHALRLARPGRIFHLAAQSSPRVSLEDPAGTLRTNLFGLLHLLEAVRKLDLKPRILIVGSAEEYGRVDPSDLPVREDAPLRPSSPYAVSKVAQEYLARQYAAAYDVDPVLTRTFNHTGSGRGEGFAESSFAKQIAEIEAGKRPAVVSVGNLDAVRDFTDVRDVCRAYVALLDRGERGEAYNVCSGRGVTIRRVLDATLALASVRVDVRVEAARLRPLDVPALVGDPTRIESTTGWKPHVPLESTLRYLLEYWRQTVGAPSVPQSR
jgi:GDP-4-dehydro-6-deoxy-D-mannose reductase